VMAVENRWGEVGFGGGGDCISCRKYRRCSRVQRVV
jgi:hypothetical protein